MIAHLMFINTKKDCLFHSITENISAVTKGNIPGTDRKKVIIIFIARICFKLGKQCLNSLDTRIWKNRK